MAAVTDEPDAADASPAQPDANKTSDKTMAALCTAPIEVDVFDSRTSFLQTVVFARNRTGNSRNLKRGWLQIRLEYRIVKASRICFLDMCFFRGSRELNRACGGTAHRRSMQLSRTSRSARRFIGLRSNKLSSCLNPLTKRSERRIYYLPPRSGR
jgi:hypothetical protein